MTIADIEEIDKIMLTATDVAPLLGFDANSIRMQAREDPTLLGFPVVVAGTRVQIPKEGFLHYLRYGRTVIIQQSDELHYEGRGA
ncbi:MAG: hypothetical protein CVU91_13485 [Firmicutes bacterium HGW-Firmicutes-16]|nr:MAG: hypothetical protein CVU91_13485 [Firmicutes bacterium HGW-Firmicutes-16]